MSEPLKPCPFCGDAEPTLDNLVAHDDYFVECGMCQLGQHAIHTKDQAIAAWNTRVVIQQEGEQKEDCSREEYGKAVGSAALPERKKI